MKSTLLAVFLLFLCLGSNAQDRMTIKVINTKGQPLKNVEVSAKNEMANDLVKGTTDASGKVTLVLKEIGVYSFSYLDQKDFDSYEVMKGLTGTFARTVTYDPKGVFAPKPKIDRSGIQFTAVSPMKLRGKPNTMKMTIRVLTTKNVRVPGVEVILVSAKDKTKMRGRANGQGEIAFHIPVNARFEVDVDGNESLKVIDSPNIPNSEMTQMVFYEKLRITEIKKGDTLIQRNISQTNGTNTHLLFNLKLLNYEGTPLADEPVYLQDVDNSRVYEGVTNRSGECKLMVQKKGNYILNLKYEEGLHLVEAKDAMGFGRESLTRRYRGSKEIERILEEQRQAMELARRREEEQRKRLKAMALAEKERRAEKKKLEKDLVIKFYEDNYQPTFRSTPVRKATRPQNYVKQTGDGYAVQFKSSGPIGTPTVIGDNMFLPAGYYSPNFYCLNASDGSYKWGVELGESGPSPAVYSNGVILINTYSCTLYAIDAKTGSLLWSKWLAGTVYSSPTADGDKVYVVFHYGGAYVLSCFDLRTGNFKWINRVDSETIACPVVEGNEVHVASQSGFYYIFNKDTGEPMEVVTSIDAVSSPTITDKSIFLTALVKDQDRLVEIDRATYKVKKVYKGELKPLRISGNCYTQMNFNGTHPIVYKNKYVVLVDHDGLKVFDAQTEQVLWEKEVHVASSQVPIVADNKIYLATTEGEFRTYDIMTGAVQVKKKHGKKIDAQPVYRKGFLYVVSSGVLTAIKFAENFQWNQWNKDATHNLRID